MHKPQRYSLINLAESIRRGGDIKAAKYERGLSGMILDVYETAHGRPGAAIPTVVIIQPLIVSQIDEYLPQAHVPTGKRNSPSNIGQARRQYGIGDRVLGSRWSHGVIIRVDTHLSYEILHDAVKVCARIIVGTDQLQKCLGCLGCQVGPDDDAEFAIGNFGLVWICRMWGCYGALYYSVRGIESHVSPSGKDDMFGIYLH